MAGSTATRGGNAQFTYDFGIAIAQSTVSKITRLTGATITLASAFYALKNTATQYVNTLRENTLHFGGVLSTMRAMEQAQDRLIKGQSYFNVDDQLRGMNRLMAAGIDVGKNIDWINKAAHATGRSFAEFSSMISSAVNGNVQSLVDAGLMTQRATKMFARFQGNTKQMQSAVMNFLKNHKGLMRVIKNDFLTIEDGTRRLKAVLTSFFESIIGKPNNPGGLYGTVANILNSFADKFGKNGVLTKNMLAIRQYGEGVGVVLTWVVRQIGHTMMWLARQGKKATNLMLGSSDTFVERMRSLVVWLEFWKLKVLDFFKDYGGAIKSVFKLLLAYKALKSVFVIGGDAIVSVMMFRREWAKLIKFMNIRNLGTLGGIGKLLEFKLLKKSKNREILRFFGLEPTKVLNTFTRLGIQIENALRGVFSKKFLLGAFGGIMKGLRLMLGLLRNLPALLVAAGNGIRALWTALNSSNPVGWIILAITLLVALYAKSESFRVLVNNIFKLIWESLKFVYNLIVGAIVYAIVGIKRVWSGIKWLWNKVTDFFSWIWGKVSGFFGWIGDLIGAMWRAFMNTAVGRFIREHIVEPLKSVFEWVVKAWKWVLKAVGKAVEILAGANSSMAKNINALAKAEGLDGLAVAVSGGNYNTDDDTNYLKKLANSVLPSKPSGNPLLSTSTAAPSGSGGGGTTNLNFSNGAVQVIVQNGEGIDEQKLAQKIREVINDIKRESSMRGGDV